MIYDHPIYRTCLRKNLAKQDCQWLRDENFITCPCSSGGKVSACNAGDLGSIPGSRRSPWRRKWQLTPVFLPGKSHGQRSTTGYRPWGCKNQTQLKQLCTIHNKIMMCYLIVVVICISLIISDVDLLLFPYWPFEYPICRNVCSYPLFMF